MEQQLDPINHVAVAVDDIAEAVEWYSRRFACRIRYQDETWAMLEFANIRMALVLPKQHAAHIAFEVDDLSSFGDVKTHRDGVRYIYIEDPSGNTVELVDRE